MPPTLDLSPDELLATTRTVRRRLDLSRPVEREVLLECLALAQQAPTAGNDQGWAFVVVTEPERRAALGELYGRAFREYVASPRSAGRRPRADPERLALQRRITRSAMHLADHMGEAPVIVVPCIRGRPEGLPPDLLASKYGSILPALWSFVLAARVRGLGAAWTTLHLRYEREAAAVLGVPYDDVAQVGLVPVAYTLGTDFRPGRREPLERIVHWEGWPQG